jgi:hypothetical protein
LRVGSRDTFDKLNKTGQMKHVLGVFKEWGKEQYGFVEFKSWEDAVAKALVTPPAEEPEDEVKKKPGLKWKSNSDKAWQHTFKKHGAKEKKRLVQIAKNTDKGKQGMWVNNEEAANYLKSIRHLIGGGPANIPIPAGMGVEIKPDGKEEPVDRAIVVPSGHSGGYTTAYPTSDYMIKAGKVIFWFGDSSGSIGLSLEEVEEEEEEE